jgi:hypothetical protein
LSDRSQFSSLVCVSCCNDAGCYPTETNVSATTSRGRDDRKYNPDPAATASAKQTIRTAEIRCALRRRALHSRPISFCFALGGADEIHPSKWSDPVPAISLCDVRSADPNKLPAGSRNAAHLLRSQMLCRSLQKRDPASRKDGLGVMNSWRRNIAGLWPQSFDIHDCDPRSRRFSAVDFYLVMLSRRGRPIARPPRLRPGIARLLDRVTALPSVRRAYAQEGITGEIC